MTDCSVAGRTSIVCEPSTWRCGASLAPAPGNGRSTVFKEDDDGPEAKRAEPDERVEGQEPRAEEARRAAAGRRERRLVVGRVADRCLRRGQPADSQTGLGHHS